MSRSTGSVFRLDLFWRLKILALLSAQLGDADHIFESSSDPLNCSIPSSYGNVSVAAENVAGVGAAGTCTAQPISELPGKVRTRSCASHNNFFCNEICVGNIKLLWHHQ